MPREKRGRKKDDGIRDIIIRYSLLALLSIGSLKLFYAIFTPLTFYPLLFILRFIYDVGSVGNTLFIEQYSIEIIGACVAASAYYLLAALNLTTREIKAGSRIRLFIFNAILILIPNILRIIVLIAMKVNNIGAFDVVHKIFWYFIGTVYVVLVWFAGTRALRIKSVPFYSDFAYVRGAIKKPNFAYVRGAIKKPKRVR